MSRKLVAFIAYTVPILTALGVVATLIPFFNPQSVSLSMPAKLAYIALTIVGLVVIRNFSTSHQVPVDSQPIHNSQSIDEGRTSDSRRQPIHPRWVLISFLLIAISLTGLLTQFDPFTPDPPGGATANSGEISDPNPPGTPQAVALEGFMDPSPISENIIVGGTVREASGFYLNAKNCQSNSHDYIIAPSDYDRHVEFSLKSADSASKEASYNVHLDNGAGWDTQRPFGPDSPVHLAMDIPSKATASIVVESSYVTDKTCSESTSFIIVDDGLVTYDP